MQIIMGAVLLTPNGLEAGGIGSKAWQDTGSLNLNGWIVSSIVFGILCAIVFAINLVIFFKRKEKTNKNLSIVFGLLAVFFALTAFLAYAGKGSSVVKTLATF